MSGHDRGGRQQHEAHAGHAESDVQAQAQVVRAEPGAAEAAQAEVTKTDEGTKVETTRVKVVSSFGLNRDDGTGVVYHADQTNIIDGEPGEYDMPKADAEHWYTLMHTENPPESPQPAMPGTIGHTAALHHEVAVRARAEAAEDQLAQQQADKELADRHQRVRRRLGTSGTFEPSGPA